MIVYLDGKKNENGDARKLLSSGLETELKKILMDLVMKLENLVKKLVLKCLLKPEENNMS